MLHQLDAARQMLERGEVESARSLASAVLKTADEHDDLSAQGHALMALSQFDRVLGRFRRAIETSHRAAQLFQLEGDIAEEASALSLLSHANSYLGRDEEAVEAALLSVKLGDLLPPGPQRVNLYNYLGVAYLRANSFANAEAALREAERLALQGSPESVLLPRINLAWLEAVRPLFQRTPPETARHVCARVHAAVADLRWEHSSPARSVSVSIGVHEAQPGDTPAALLRRSDVAMFQAKGRA